MKRSDPLRAMLNAKTLVEADHFCTGKKPMRVQPDIAAFSNFAVNYR